MKHPFKRLRREAKWLAIVTTLLSIIVLLVLAQYAPPAPGEDVDGFRLSSNWYQSLQSLVTAILSVGLLSLLFEIFLRETHGGELTKYLDLKTSVVSSGLRRVMSPQEFDWRKFLEGRRQVQAVVRDESWVIANASHLVNVARGRVADISVALPDEDGGPLQHIAAARGTTETDVRSRIVLARDHLDSSWKKAAGALAVGSTLNVYGFNANIAFDVVRADDDVAVSLSDLYSGTSESSEVILVFSLVRVDTFPAKWLIKQVEDVLTDESAVTLSRRA